MCAENSRFSVLFVLTIFNLLLFCSSAMAGKPTSTLHYVQFQKMVDPETGLNKGSLKSAFAELPMDVSDLQIPDLELEIRVLHELINEEHLDPPPYESSGTQSNEKCSDKTTRGTP